MLYRDECVRGVDAAWLMCRSFGSCGSQELGFQSEAKCCKDTNVYGVATISRLLKIVPLFGENRSLFGALLQKRPIILRSLLIVATPYEVSSTRRGCNSLPFHSSIPWLWAKSHVYVSECADNLAHIKRTLGNRTRIPCAINGARFPISPMAT